MQMDATLSNSAAATAPAAPYTPLIPRDQDDKADLAVRLGQAWKLNPQLTFIWTTQVAFEATAADFQRAIRVKTAAAVLRPGLTLTLAEADDKVTEGLPYLKAALLTKFKKGKDKALYPQFGIISRNGGFDLPDGQAERRDGLALLVKALTTHGLTAGDYGLAFWEPVEEAYRQGVVDARANDAAVGTLMGIKNTVEAQVDRVLSRMLDLIDAQYPDEIERDAKRRELGYSRRYS